MRRAVGSLRRRAFPGQFGLPQTPIPSPRTPLHYKLEPQADVARDTSVPCPHRQSHRRAELVADRPPQPHIAQTGNTTTLPDLYRSSTTRPPSPTASRAPPRRSKPAAVRPTPRTAQLRPSPDEPRPPLGAALAPLHFSPLSPRRQPTPSPEIAPPFLPCSVLPPGTSPEKKQKPRGLSEKRT